MKYGIRLLVLAALALLFATSNASSCPVCYGDTGSKMAEGINAAILVLLGITGSVLGLFSAVFMRIRRRMKMTLDGAVDYPSKN